MPFIIMSEPVKTPRGGTKRRRIAVIETNLPIGETPSRIDWRAAGVVQIVREWEDTYIGKSRHSSFFRAMDEAEELVRRLIVQAAIAHKRVRLAKQAQP